MPAVYIHIPFCVSKCHYCDFNSWAWGKQTIPEQAYLSALGREVSRWKAVLNFSSEEKIPSIFFGGGTPSLFSVEAIAQALEQGRRLGNFYADTEVTLELNPKTADQKKLEGFRRSGVNRISMGIQTLDDALLHELGRAHSAEEALQALAWAFAAGFERVNADLMYGLPRQTVATLEGTLHRLEDFSLRHLSAYELIVEEGTPYFELEKTGSLPLPESETTLEMRRLLKAFTLGHGMRAYEISNYAHEGHESLHNLGYWDYRSFVGIGAGAVSFFRAKELSPAFWEQLGRTPSEDLFGLRLTNPKDLGPYQDGASAWTGVAVEEISRPVAMAEFLMMGLRKRSGVRLEDFRQNFGCDWPPPFQRVMAAAVEQGRMAVSAETCRFTDTGWLWSNDVLSEFFGELTESPRIVN